MNTSASLTRREMLAQCSTGFGLMALQGLMSSPAFGDKNKKPHFKPRAKHVILCYMSGGASHVDTFDPKPKLKKMHGKPIQNPQDIRVSVGRRTNTVSLFTVTERNVKKLISV